MRLAVGARLGPYEVLGPLGAGGMGEVYKARDTRLLRTVALKVLSSDAPHRGDRFAREARALSSLSHPHICSIYDIGEHDEAAFLVMEYLDGQTLAERLDLGPLPLDAALRYAIEIAGALAEAHRQGLIHRDLKPSNVMLTRDGAKVLDFGLVKLMSAEGETEQTHTRDSQLLTGEGVVVGTAPYMSPEQIEGKPVDARTDLFALGSVLFEMVTGKRAFDGDSRAGVIAAVLTKEPPSLTALQPLASAALSRVVAKCLAKDPEDRWQTARDLASEVRWILEAGSEAGVPRKVAGRRRGRSLLWGALLGAVVAGAAIAGILAFKTSRRPPPSFEQVTFRRGYLHEARFAPDGQTIVYSAAWDGELFEVFSTRRGSTESRPLGFKPARVAAISRSGEIALIVGTDPAGTLVRAPLAGGAPRELLENATAADWTPDGSDLAVVRRIRGPKETKWVVELPMGHAVFESESPISTIRVSPKGDRFALAASPSGQGVLSILDRSGANTTLSKGWSMISGLAWSPQGDEVWFTAARVGSRASPPAVWAVSLSGQERLLATAPVGYQMNDVFRDGSVLLGVNNSRAGLLCLPPGETKERELGWLNYSSIEGVSPDGQTLLFAAGETGRGPLDTIPAVYLRSIDGSPAVRLGDGHPQGLSPDGRWVLVARADSKAWFLLPTRAGMPRTLPPGPIAQLGGGAWLDEKRIVLWGREEGHGPRIYIQDLETGVIRSVAPEGVRASRHGALTPDGKAVLALASGEGKWSLYPVDGGDPRPMTFLTREDEPVQWSADGRVLYLVHRGESARESSADVYRLEVATGRRELWKTLAPPDPAGVEWIDRVVLTRDARSYCYTYSQTLTSLQVVEGLR